MILFLISLLASCIDLSNSKMLHNNPYQPKLSYFERKLLWNKIKSVSQFTKLIVKSNQSHLNYLSINLSLGMINELLAAYTVQKSDNSYVIDL